MQGTVETSVADGSGALCAAVQAVLPNIALQLSAWQAADAARVLATAAAAAERARFAALRPPELSVLVRRSSAAARHAPQARRSALRAAWRFAVLAVRAQLRGYRDRASSARRSLDRHRVYVAACAILVVARQGLEATKPGTSLPTPTTDALAASLMHWLSSNRPNTAESNSAAESVLSRGGGWCGSQRACAPQPPGGDGVDSADLAWLHDVTAVSGGATETLLAVASLALRAADDPAYSSVTLRSESTEGTGKSEQLARGSVFSRVVELAVPDDGGDSRTVDANLLEGSVWQYGLEEGDEADPLGWNSGAAADAEAPQGHDTPGFPEKRAAMSVAELVQVRAPRVCWVLCAMSTLPCGLTVVLPGAGWLKDITG